MPSSIRPGDVLADRYRLVDLLAESSGGRFWRAHDKVLERHVALHTIAADDERAAALLEAARRSAMVHDRRLLRVLDADHTDGLVYVVNEWGSGDSLDIMLANEGPLGARRAAWLVSEVAASIAAGHDAGVAHGRLVPENVLVDHGGAVRIIGFAVDAALHGLPPGRASADVVDLGGVLYSALTGKWPGTERSGVPRAPVVQGRVLRPRQVRAGIPRPLDALCDEVINPYGGGWGARLRETHDLATAAGISDFLAEFVGDPTGLAAAEAAAGHRDTETISLPALADPPVREPEPDPEPTPEPAPRSTELPTQAGLPIFDDENDDVSWIAARADPAPPPPPFEEPPERPLFAPEPAEGPARRTRHPAHHGARASFWPWDDDAPSGTGPIVADPPEDEGVPGRSWLRLAAVIGGCLLLLVAIVVAFNLGRGRTPLGDVPDDGRDTTPSSAATSGAAAPITGITATDLDPQGDPPEENPELTGLAVDGDPGTAWRTMTYLQNFGPGGLKTGAGLVLDLGAEHDVSSVDLTFVGAPTGYSLYLSDQAPDAVAGLTPVATGTADGTRARVALDAGSTGRFLTVWLTSLPAIADGFRGEVAEVAVRG
ncbi:protein kinase family protein [Nocardioides sp.]|uniref:protein kinase family protein n=1 Tax=Nocardioides sp. TaxID=35761 RepID=UPI0026271642|nr:protein kinase family protein [Nocardioides sp.]MDI6910153.1 protein kinase family protein [Nocardioides sp.]